MLTKFEMLRDSLREIRGTIADLENELQCEVSGYAYRAWCRALDMERDILALMERTE